MDSWPVGLQQKLNADAFEVRLGSTSVRTDMDVGPAKVRSRFTDAVDTYSAQIFLDYSEYATFLTFYKTTLNNGVNQFLFDDPFTELPTAFRFVEAPTIRPLGGRMFSLSMNWEKMP